MTQEIRASEQFPSPKSIVLAFRRCILSQSTRMLHTWWLSLTIYVHIHHYHIQVDVWLHTNSKQPIYKYNFSCSWAAVSARLRVYRFEPRCCAGGKPLLVDVPSMCALAGFMPCYALREKHSQNWSAERNWLVSYKLAPQTTRQPALIIHRNSLGENKGF
jgi:hypothetical protein